MGVGLRQALQVVTLVLQVATLAPWEEGSVPAELGTQRECGGKRGPRLGRRRGEGGHTCGGRSRAPQEPRCLPSSHACSPLALGHHHVDMARPRSVSHTPGKALRLRSRHGSGTGPRCWPTAGSACGGSSRADQAVLPPGLGPGASVFIPRGKATGPSGSVSSAIITLSLT